ncbi:MAG: cation diffusion facilitator family transporter [Gammaproteobacteria bacterium]|nr:cation diffusion facilitator family transporter [Gammaproteobacteria bacterium]
MSQAGSPAKAILYAFLANFGIAVSKLAAALHTGSGSLMAEAIHSFADTCNQVLLFVGLKGSEKPADEEHPLGYGKLTYFWSFVVALILFSLGGVYSIFEGWHKYNNPEPVTGIWIGLSVLGAAIILEGLSFYGAYLEAKKMAGEQFLMEWLKTTRNAEIVVVLGEDFAAMLGLIFAFLALSLVMVTGEPLYDAFGSMVIGVLLIIVAVGLVIRLQGLLVGRSAEPALRELAESIIAEKQGVARLFNMVTLHMGPKVLLAAKIQLDAHLTVDQAAHLINAIEDELKANRPEIGWCYIEIDP